MNYIDIKKEAQVVRSISFSSDLDIFTHHFPDMPLLPGALSALLLSETCGGPEWTLSHIGGLRFRRPLVPNLPVTITCSVTNESASEKKCSGRIGSETETIADGEFTFTRNPFAVAEGKSSDAPVCFWNSSQIRDYLPHGEPIVLIDRFVTADYPQEIRDTLDGKNEFELDQAKLLGTKIHTTSNLNRGSYWLDQKGLPSPILIELVAQAGALTLAPFFKGTKPQVSLLGCDTEFFAQAEEGAKIDTFVELTRVKKLGKSANMIIFKCQCFVSDTKIASISLNAMASF